MVKRDILDSSINDVAKLLEKRNLKHAAKAFKAHSIGWRHFDKETTQILEYLGNEIEQNIPYEDRPLHAESVTSPASITSKVINDPVHGQIELPELCVYIIDTPQFQRLRYLKQLGSTHFVYPGGSHSRFEHSLGVCYLAGKLVRRLRKNQPVLEITDEDVLCVQIAGLCHDLGHGPFSHVFDQRFMARVKPNRKWKHEEASVKMLDYIMADTSNRLVTKFRDYNLTLEDYYFIQEMIHPSVREQKLGRPKTKRFLYEIVSNSRNGIDVDKWDYLARDCHHLGLTSGYDHTRFIHLARVIKDEVTKEVQIGVRDKEALNMYEMFHTRHILHRKAYQHKVCNAIDIMLVEAMIKANNGIQIPGKCGKVNIADCVDDMVAFTNLTDNIFHQILLSTDEDITPKERDNVREAKEILQLIQRREIYPLIYESCPLNSATFPRENQEEHVLNALLDFLPSLTSQQRQDLRGCLHVQVYFVNFGKMDKNKKDANPVLDLRFYTKANIDKGITLQANQVSTMIPQTHGEIIVRVFINFKIKPEQKDLLQTAIHNFREEYENHRKETDLKRLTSQDANDHGTQELQKTEGVSLSKLTVLFVLNINFQIIFLVVMVWYVITLSNIKLSLFYLSIVVYKSYVNSICLSFKVHQDYINKRFAKNYFKLFPIEYASEQ